MFSTFFCAAYIRSTQVVPEIALPVETNDGGDGDDDDDEEIEPSTPRYARPPIQLKERDEITGVEAPEVRHNSPFELSAVDAEY